MEVNVGMGGGEAWCHAMKTNDWLPLPTGSWTKGQSALDEVCSVTRDRPTEWLAGGCDGSKANVCFISRRQLSRYSDWAMG
jgi:hypothetical protein